MRYMETILTPALNAFQAIAPEQRKTLLEVRELIFEVAASDPRICDIEETIKWGEPAYITVNDRTGSTIRLGIDKATEMPAIFFNCKTTLVEEFRQMFGAALRYTKNRAIILDGECDELKPVLKICIAAAMTYHLND